MSFGVILNTLAGFAQHRRNHRPHQVSCILPILSLLDLYREKDSFSLSFLWLVGRLHRKDYELFFPFVW